MCAIDPIGTCGAVYYVSDLARPHSTKRCVENAWLTERFPAPRRYITCHITVIGQRYKAVEAQRIGSSHANSMDANVEFSCKEIVCLDH